MAQIGGFLDLRSRTPAKDCMDGEKKRFWMEKSPIELD